MIISPLINAHLTGSSEAGADPDRAARLMETPHHRETRAPNRAMRYPIHMSALPLIPSSPAEPPPNRKRFTRAEVRSMDEAGLFAGQRLELIEGDLIDKMGQRPPHASTIQLLLVWLAGVFGLDRVRVQLPVEAAPADRERSLPEPD